MNITAFLPCRQGSQRVPQKNIRPFAGIEGGLTTIKLKHLLQVPEIDRIIVSSDDEEVKRYARECHSAKILIDDRPAQYASSETSTDDLISYVADLIREETEILWTHVTSPFFDSEEYSKAIKLYQEKKEEGYDSLMSVDQIQAFIWDEKGPISYDLAVEKWPRTQTIKPLYEINSAIFLASSKIYQEQKNRIGNNPYLLVSDPLKSFDIDWENDFLIAEQNYILNNR